jgi:hypothetical protein
VLQLLLLLPSLTTVTYILPCRHNLLSIRSSESTCIVWYKYSVKFIDRWQVSLFGSSTPLLCIPETLSNEGINDNIEHQSVYNRSYVYYICLDPITWAYKLPPWAQPLHQRTRARAIARSTVRNNGYRRQRGFSQDLNYFSYLHFQIFREELTIPERG